VQLVTINIIPDRIHGVYQQQQTLNESCNDSLTGLLAQQTVNEKNKEVTQITFLKFLLMGANSH